ncbi:hypothetical protein GTA08_BOTSDO03841 [Botryosphaeria dothidea]|uniref:Uncharacterized protein n=1 Tax=Botryosphaeria dothidea TaxID=55169 RepID=A0A8H4N710_9PEZI|nr:hypothetical protein GTA08_BOTSDO03841 [Botryosphaeria dothidea]
MMTKTDGSTKSSSSNGANTADGTVSSTSSAPPTSADSITALKHSTEETKKQEQRHMSLLTARLRETTRTYKSMEKEREEAASSMRELFTRKRKLDRELDPVGKKKRQVEHEVEVAKRKAGITKVVGLLLEMEEPEKSLGEVVRRFRRELVEKNAEVVEEKREGIGGEVVVKREKSNVKEKREGSAALQGIETARSASASPKPMAPVTSNISTAHSI